MDKNEVVNSFIAAVDIAMESYEFCEYVIRTDVYRTFDPISKEIVKEGLYALKNGAENGLMLFTKSEIEYRFPDHYTKSVERINDNFYHIFSIKNNSYSKSPGVLVDLVI